MLVLQETTVWEGKTPNHVYFLTDNKDKMIGYVNAVTGEVKRFSQPRGFDARKRTFKAVKNTWGFDDSDKPTNPTWQVQGSKETYTVEQTEDGLTCTCMGFKFRGKCKHVDQIKAQIK